jgi:hypothetical protein
VLADLAEAAASGTPGDSTGLAGALVTLETNYRFGNDSPIFRLCGAVREGDSQTALELALQSGGRPLPKGAELRAELKEAVLKGYGPYLAERDPVAALAAF